MTLPNKFKRYIKNSDGKKTENVVTSVNLTQEQHAFLKKHDLNLSHIIREHIDNMIKQTKAG